MKKLNEGITLGALVVTIIVLLILAGVSLNLVAGSSGIMNSATKAVDAAEVARMKEEIEMVIAELQMDYYSDYTNQNGTVREYVESKLKEGVKSSTGAIILCDENSKIKYNDKEVGILEEDGTVTMNGETGGTSTPIAKEYTVTYDANGGSGVPTDTRKYKKGETVTVDFTTIPTQAGCTFLGWARTQDAVTPEFTNSGSITVDGNTTLYAVWEYGQAWHAMHPEKHIPTGFAHTEGTAEEGYVIADSEGNEFVWIPVASDEAYQKKLGTNNWTMKEKSTGVGIDKLSSVVEAVKGDKIGLTNIVGTAVNGGSIADRPEAVVVNKAGGFWVGRYEAGTDSVARGQNQWIAGVESGSKDKSAEANAYWESKAISVKVGNEPARVITQSKALERANGWKSGAANVTAGTVAFQSGLITGAQWDAMCDFIGWNTCDTDCRIWGNYINVESKIYTSLTHSTAGKSGWFTENGSIQKRSNNYWTFSTGVFETAAGRNTAQKNIYDVAGNVWEWTTEIPQYSETNAVLRGGCSGDNSINTQPTGRDGSCSGTLSVDAQFGFRLVLYVE